MTTEPKTELDPRYGDPDAAATGWDQAREQLAAAELSWLTTVRPDGRPHVTPLITVMVGSTLHFCTGPDERKCRNLQSNPNVALTTGSNNLHGGIDLVVEGRAVRVTDEPTLRQLADAYVTKYGQEWRFDVGDGVFLHSGNDAGAWVFAVPATTVFGFGKDPYSQTRWSFDPTSLPN
jgi:general stress protein 26